MTEITVVIPNYKGIRFIRDCLTALYAQDPKTPDYEVVVVDNASGDGSVELIRREFPQVKLICLQENTGFCRAVNVGIRESSAPYVVLLNNDTKVFPDFLLRLYETARKDPKIFSVSAAMRMWDAPDRMDDAGDQYCIFGWAFARGKGKPFAKYSERKTVFSACGGAALYKRSILEEIGLFDERHFAYLEDLDLGYRARIHGYENVYEPAAGVIHYGSASTGSRYNEWKTRRAAANSVYVIAKNMPLLQILLNFPFLMAGFLIKYLFFVKKKMGRLYLQGLADGLRMSVAREGRSKKIVFRFRNLIHYLGIEWRLIQGTFCR